MNLRKFVYFGYYVKNLDAKKLTRFVRYASSRTGKPAISLLLNAIGSVFKYNISIMEYFQFGFYERERAERLGWAGTGFMFEYQRIMNPLKARSVLENKIAFNSYFNQFIKRDFTTLPRIEKDPEEAQHLIDSPSEKIVLKNSLGQAGREIRILNSQNLKPDQLLNIMRSGKFDLVEEYIVQHPDMMRLSPSGINTVRLITQETNGRIEVLAARLRISINSNVDNMAAGNAASPVDPISGKVTGPAVFSDITKPDITVHPVTGVEIPGFQLPFWNEILEMVKKAAMSIPENRSIGWDVAITPKGPLLVEGNHNWCKLLWQLPVRQGLKKELEKYL